MPLQEPIAGIDSSPFPARLILKSTAKLSASGSDLTFRDWNYVTTSITFDLIALLSLIDSNGLVCLDTGCGVTLMDRDWLAKNLPLQKISIIPVPLKVRGIGALKHELKDFTLTTIYILGIDEKDCEIYVSISYKLISISISIDCFLAQ